MTISNFEICHVWKEPDHHGVTVYVDGKNLDGLDIAIVKPIKMPHDGTKESFHT